MTDRLRPFRVSDQQEDAASEIRRIVHGSFTFDAPSLAAFGVGTATAALAGLATDMNVLAQLIASGATAGYGIIGARCPSADIVEVTLANMHSATNDPSSVSAKAFAWR